MVYPGVTTSPDSAAAASAVLPADRALAEGVRVFRDLLPPPQTVVDVPLLDSEPTDLASVDALSRTIEERFAAAASALVEPGS